MSFSSCLLQAWFKGGASGNRLEGRRDWVVESNHENEENITIKAGFSILGTLLLVIEVTFFREQ